MLLIQTTIVSRLNFIYGGADLYILFLSAWSLQVKSSKNIEFVLIATTFISIASALPFYIYLITYLSIISLAYFLKKRIWQTPILALAFTIIVATLINHGLTIFWIRINGTAIPVEQAIGLITVPTVFMNLLLSIPVYIVIRNIIEYIYPYEGDE